MTETATNLRQADAFLTIEGVLSEMKLEKARDKEGKNVVKGNMSIKTSETNFVTVNVYVNELTKSGEKNKAYSGIETVMNEYKSIAAVGAKEATKVRIGRGQVQPNTYINRDGDVQTNIRYSSNFFNRITDAEEFKPRAEMEVEGYISSIVNEVDKDGEETGRLKINLYMPTYAGIEPFAMVVPADIADAVTSTFEVGQTAKFYADIVNKVDIKEEVIQLAVGGTKTKVHKEFLNEIQMTGAENPYEPESPKAYSSEVIRQALADREIKIDNMKKEAAEAKSKANSPAANKPVNGRPLPTGFRL